MILRDAFSPPRIQVVFNECVRTLRGNPRPSCYEFLRLRDLFAGLRLQDVGLTDTDLKIERAAITCVTVAAEPEFEISVFIVPRGVSLALHDHYGMAVVFQVLAGIMDALVYDTSGGGKSGEAVMEGYGSVRERSAPSGAPLLGRRLFHGPIDGHQGPIMVWPAAGNLHELHAVTDCAFIDLQAPPYHDRRGRDCRYFVPTPLATSAEVALYEVPTPPQRFVSRPYHGPRLVTGSPSSLHPF